ncbi:MAG: prolipoprotein diacylglyceryl transferase [Elusimicrobia bacterium]|nr:prolipoprotein diacylglyceryl transferase [Elusimicrobiota bacterium]
MTAVIDPTGRVANMAPWFEQSVIVHRVPLLSGQTVYTKLGNWFAGGCCWGAPTESPLGVVYTNALCSVPVHLRGIPLHPVQLYESAGAFILFLILNSVKDKYKGQIFGFYMIGYGILRFCIEFFRPESTLKGPNLPGLSFTQTIILFLLIPAGVWLIAKVRQGKIKVDVQEPVSNLV